MIYTFTPFSIEKNFGGAINKCCQIVPEDDDWICIRDGDTMNLTPDWGKVIDAAIFAYGEDYQIFGSWTNRLNKNSKQLIPGMYDEFNILHHYMKAIEKTKDIGITEVNLVAGFFMLFQKKTWEAVGGFHEFDKTFDVKFCKEARGRGGKIGIINKLYMFHLYRVWADKNPSHETKHLL